MMEFMEFFKPHMDLDDQILHYLIAGFGLGIGSLAKKGFDFFAAKFWDTEYKQFQQWREDEKAGHHKDFLKWKAEYIIKKIKK
jgi:hypothetical protein